MPKNWSKTEERRSLLERDNWLCGIHTEGCMEKVDSPEPSVCTIDHIIPQQVYQGLGRGKWNKEFNRWWNKQPMHSKCNAQRKAGHERGWPDYRCMCHFLYLQDDNAYIYALEEGTSSSDWVWGKHLFLKGIIRHEEPSADTFSCQMVPEKWKQPGGGIVSGWSREPLRGHVFGCIHSVDVDKWNALFTARVGLLSSSAIGLGLHLARGNPVQVAAGDCLEESFFVGDVPFSGIILPMRIPVLMVLPPDALITWEHQPFDRKHWRLVTPNPLWKMPLNQELLVRWVGGSPPATKDTDVLKRMRQWFACYGLQLDFKPVSYLDKSRIPRG